MIAGLKGGNLKKDVARDLFPRSFRRRRSAFMKLEAYAVTAL
jgi:DNA recombination-dependent growth factor C